MTNNCTYKTKKKNIVCKENSRRFCIINKKEKNVEVGKVDGCLITGARERCDYYFDVENTLIFFVELKGCNIKKAISQIISSVNFFESKHSIDTKIGIIVCSKVPRIGTDFQKAVLTKQKALKKHSLKIERPKCGGCDVKV